MPAMTPDIRSTKLTVRLVIYTTTNQHKAETFADKYVLKADRAIVPFTLYPEPILIANLHNRR